jgi:hypothetical protein
VFLQYVSVPCSYALHSNLTTSRSTATESAYNPRTALVDVESLFPPTDPCRDCTIPADWASPLTCQFVYETTTVEIESQTLLIAELTHKWLGTFLDGDSKVLVPTEERLRQRASFRQQLERFGAAEKNSDIEAVHIYEGCRWATRVLLTVEKMSISISAAEEYLESRPRPVQRLRMTNLANLWGKRRGLLFWITIVCHFSIAGHCFPLLCETLLAHFTHEMAMTTIGAEIGIKPLRRLKTFESLCCNYERQIVEETCGHSNAVGVVLETI